MLKRYNALLINTRHALSEWVDVVIAAEHEQVMQEKDVEIAALTEELRLSGLRGDSLDRVIEEGVQKELALEAAIERQHQDFDRMLSKYQEQQKENEVLREQNSTMNASLVKLRLEVERLREALEHIVRQDTLEDSPVCHAIHGFAIFARSILSERNDLIFYYGLCEKDLSSTKQAEGGESDGL